MFCCLMFLLLQRRSLAPSQVAKRKQDPDSEDEDWEPDIVRFITMLMSHLKHVIDCHDHMM